MTDIIVTSRANYGPPSVEEQLAFDRLALGNSFHFERDGQKVRIEPRHIEVSATGVVRIADDFADIYRAK